jgi:hypothetical protein
MDPALSIGTRQQKLNQQRFGGMKFLSKKAVETDYCRDMAWVGGPWRLVWSARMAGPLVGPPVPYSDLAAAI